MDFTSPLKSQRQRIIVHMVSVDTKYRPTINAIKTYLMVHPQRMYSTLTGI